jgi:hypothetical protein
MAFFASTTGKGVPCYNGTFCSDTVFAELTNEHFIAKARLNPDFTEVFPKAPVVEVQPRPVKKTRKKRVSKK